MLKAAIFLFSVVALATTASCDTYNNTFSAFTGIDNGLSLDGAVNVSTSAGEDYTVVITASKEFIDALDVDVSEDVLSLGFKDNTQIDDDDDDDSSLQILVPAASLSQLTQSGSGDLNVDGTVFTSNQTLDLSLSGSGDVRVSNVTVSDITVDQSGSSDLVLDGTVDTVTVQTSGSGSAYLYGVQTGVNLDASGSGELGVDGQGSDVEITGSISGSYDVVYISGTCSVTGTGSGSVCEQVNDIDD